MRMLRSPSSWCSSSRVGRAPINSRTKASCPAQGIRLLAEPLLSPFFHLRQRSAGALARRRSLDRDSPPDRRKQGPIQFLENNPTQSSFWVRFMCPKTRRNWLRLPIVRFHPGSSCPQAAALRRSHTRGRRPPPFSARSRVSWHTVNLRSAPSSAIIRTSEHFHVFRRPHA
jgi:hypothetical protein